MGTSSSTHIKPTLSLVDISTYDKVNVVTLTYCQFYNIFLLKSQSTNTITIELSRTDKDLLIKFIRHHIDNHFIQKRTLNIVTNFIPINNEHYGPGQEKQLLNRIEELLNAMTIVKIKQ